MEYLHWDEKTITDFSPENIESMYQKGYVFTRKGKGVMQQTRSFKINTDNFELNSENRRILKKVPDIALTVQNLPLDNYDFLIAKIGKDFYDTKFGKGIMSAQKIKEMLTEPNKSNFNALLTFNTGLNTGYVISFISKNILHYSYPFYSLDKEGKDLGLAMMIKAIEYAKNSGIKEVYLGSLQRPNDTYKLQFESCQWFDGQKWNSDLDKAKKILKEQSQN
jgi:arginyl-tRNA--protein-N-Asp/Glu arginylyltransferase